ncbi:ParB N-terminal domain-containing protein [Staphylococcus capitis]|uniref:ParB N-terminal domain-containing protein n=1 Tax=Staphylococcus capitis TaxID=29388 RepID=UPI0030D0672C
MKEIESIEISKLKFDEDINQLVPEMTEEEFSDLVKSIEEEGQRTPIHINKDNTILDGRHRVRALEELNIKEVSAIKENMSKSEALKFVRDTAVKRRSLNANQKLNIVLNTKDLIDDLQERAKTNQGTRNDLTFSSAEPKVKKTPVHENKEIADLAGVSTSTVMRAKKVKREDPETYEKVIKENSGWNKAYNELPSVKNKEYQKNLKNKRIEVESEVSNEELELLAQSQTLIKRFQDLALCTKNSSDIEKVINKALKTDFEDIKEAYFKVERLFSLIGLKIEANGGTK